jgi:predicted kinase
VAAGSGDPKQAAAYVEAAIAHLAPPPPMLAAVGGLSGSGKSRFSRAIAPALGASPGAVILRTDEIRKRIAGVAPTQPIPREAYTPQAAAQTYDAMMDNARAMLSAGRAVVLDATFLDPALRDRAQALAAEVGVPFKGAWLDAPAEVLEARCARRTGDASDATVEVLRDQIARLDRAAITWPLVDTEAPKGAAAQAWLGALDG